MRLAIVTLMGGMQWGGSEALWHSLAKFALDQGDEVFVSIYDWGSLHEKVKVLQLKGACIHTRNRYNANAGFAERISRFVKSRRPSLDKDYQAIIDFRPDAVFISQGDSFDLAVHHRPLYILLRKNDIPYSFVCHSHLQYSFIPPKEIYQGAHEIFENAREVYFVSDRQWKLTERRLASKIVNGIFTWNPLNVIPPENPLPWPSSEKVKMAMVASISGSKGHDTILEVLAEPNWKERNWVLNIYGGGEGKSYVEKLALFYGLSKNVVFHGHVSNIGSIWENNHALLIPSAGEGLPISLVEAMACGRMGVVTDVGGNTELITDCKTGFVAASPATHAYASALEKAWNERNHWKQLGINAFNKINQVLDKSPEAGIYKKMQDGLN